MSNLLIVGVGNPGEAYRHNRHNFGFMAIDMLSKHLRIKLEYDKKKSIFGIGRIKKSTVIILKPQTFANLSGEAVLYLASFLKVDLRSIVILYDEPYSPLGRVEFINGVKDEKRIKQIKNGAVQSLVYSLNSAAFNAIELGIGPVKNEDKVEEFSLQDFTEKETALFDKTFDQVKIFIKDFIELSEK